MKRIELLPGIETSALGFGCAPILGAVDGAASRVALAAALDVGITHFDLARSYGYGQAEKFVGNFLKGRRAEVTIATKFGIEATPMAALLSPVKPLLRFFRPSGNKPSGDTQPRVSGGAGSKIANLLHKRRAITSDRLRLSLETSLRQLKTDYVDILLIHEPVGSITAIDDLIATANAMKAAGKLKAFGIAFMQNQETLHKTYLDRFELQQFDNSPGTEHYQKTVRERALAANIFFSPFRGAKEKSEPVQILQQLHADFPNSVTLCSMFNPKHIRQNAAAFAE